MTWWRRKTPVVPAPERLSVSEARVASAWGYTEQQWRGLTDARRVYCRENLVHGPYFTR